MESHNKWQGKVYQLEYPSPRAHQRRQSQQVLVQKQMSGSTKTMQW